MAKPQPEAVAAAAPKGEMDPEAAAASAGRHDGGDDVRGRLRWSSA